MASACMYSMSSDGSGQCWRIVLATRYSHLMARVCFICSQGTLDGLPCGLNCWMLQRTLRMPSVCRFKADMRWSMDSCSTLTISCVLSNIHLVVYCDFLILFLTMAIKWWYTFSSSLHCLASRMLEILHSTEETSISTFVWRCVFIFLETFWVPVSEHVFGLLFGPKVLLLLFTGVCCESIGWTGVNCFLQFPWLHEELHNKVTTCKVI